MTDQNSQIDIDLFATAAYRVVADYFDITMYRSSGNTVLFWANPRLHKRGWKRRFQGRLGQLNARGRVTREGEQYLITITPLSRTIGFPPFSNIILFVLTTLTVLFMAAFNEKGSDLFSDWMLIFSGLPFAATLMGILLLHEMGHFWAGHKRGVIMSYPYFIPAPTFTGTFGALIRSRTPIRSRNDLILIGAAGPLAGAVPSIIALAWGYTSSTIEALPEGPVLLFGDSLLTWILQTLMLGPVPDGMVVHISQVAFAGYVGLLVTMLNLLPLGQLDGGHIMYGLFERGQKVLAILFMFFLFVLGFYWQGWWLWLAIALIMRPFHPPIIDHSTPPDRRHAVMGWIALLLFVLTFVPRPIS